MEQAGKEVDYYALDVSLPELERTFADLPRTTFKYVRCHGLFGTYADGLKWLKQPENHDCPKCILSMGSSVGNFNREQAASFLNDYAQILRPRDMMLIGLDACQDGERVFHAYNDKEGITHGFLRNGLTHANRILGEQVFKNEDWHVLGEYNAAQQCHQAFYTAVHDLSVDGIRIKAGERIRVEESYKYSAAQSRKLWQSAGLMPKASFGNRTDDYRE